MKDENMFEMAPQNIRSITFVLIDLFNSRIVYQSNDIYTNVVYVLHFQQQQGFVE